MKEPSYYIERYNQLKLKKEKHRTEFEEINRFVRLRGQLFEDSDTGWDSDVAYDATAPNAARKLAAILMGLMWPNASKVLRFNLVDKIQDKKENRDWIQECQKTQAEIMDASRVGFSSAAYQAMYELVTFGTGGTFVSEDSDRDVSYTTWGVNNIVIDEGKNGIVNTIYYSEKWTPKKIVETYGEENVSKEVRDCFKGNINKKFKIIQAIEPSFKKKNGVALEDYDSIHFEFDSKQILKKGRFDELPCFIARYYKDIQSVYGRSSSTEIMPTIRELNRKKQSRDYFEEQELDPAMGYDVNSFGGDTIDKTPGSWNPFNFTLAGTNGLPFRLIPSVNLNISEESLINLKEDVSDAYSLDRLLDFNNNTQMTATETMARNEIRGQSNIDIFNRLDSEYFTPIVERTFNLIYKKGLFGVIKGSEEHDLLERENAQRKTPKEIKFIPDDIAKVILEGEEFYKVSFNSPAERMKMSEELQSTNDALMMTGSIAQMKPEVLDWFDESKAIKKIFENRGADLSLLRAPDEVEKIRQEREAAQQKAQAEQMRSMELENAQKEKELTNG